jgi:hypothetical protein
MLLINLLATVSTGWKSNSSETPAKALPITRAPPCWLLSEFGADVASTLLESLLLDAFIAIRELFRFQRCVWHSKFNSNSLKKQQKYIRSENDTISTAIDLSSSVIYVSNALLMQAVQHVYICSVQTRPVPRPGRTDPTLMLLALAYK